MPPPPRSSSPPATGRPTVSQRERRRRGVGPGGIQEGAGPPGEGGTGPVTASPSCRHAGDGPVAGSAAPHPAGAPVHPDGRPRREPVPEPAPTDESTEKPGVPHSAEHQGDADEHGHRQDRAQQDDVPDEQCAAAVRRGVHVHVLRRRERGGHRHGEQRCGVEAIGSFVGGTVSIVALTLLAPLVAGFALDFGPPEYTALALLGILLVSTVGGGSRLKALVAACVGLLLATVGRDTFTGAERFTSDYLNLADGLDFVPIAMGLFGLGEILYNLEERHRTVHAPASVANVWPSGADLRQSSGAIGRGSVLGFFLGILPGGGATIASLAAYALEKRRSKTPERFGRGAVEGVAAPETANNAAATSSFIPLLTLGIPANGTMAVIFGALLIQGGARARSSSPRSRTSSGAWSTPCTSATSCC